MLGLSLRLGKKFISSARVINLKHDSKFERIVRFERVATLINSHTELNMKQLIAFSHDSLLDEIPQIFKSKLM